MHFHSVDWQKWISIVSACLAPIIAVAVAVIAFQQWRTNTQQLRLALFEKRMAVFDGTLKFILTTLRQNTVELAHLNELWQDVQKHTFLFGADVSDYIEELYRKGNQLGATKAGIVAGQQADIKMHTELLLWFNDQRKVVNEKFLKYMDFRKP